MTRCARYSPGGQLFICENEEQVSALEAAGWKPLPTDHAKPYPPDKAEWVKHWGDVRDERKKPKPKE